MQMPDEDWNVQNSCSTNTSNNYGWIKKLHTKFGIISKSVHLKIFTFLLLDHEQSFYKWIYIERL